ncbi:hypothetical protein ACVWXN_010713 [Bradyrhizobium sp. i1.4.4]
MSPAQAITRRPVSRDISCAAAASRSAFARDDDDMRLLAREFGGNGTTDADAAAGHDGNLAAQVQIHDATLTR